MPGTMPAFGWRRRPLSTPSSTPTQGRASWASTISVGAPIQQQNPWTTSAGGGTPPTGEWRGSEATVARGEVLREKLDENVSKCIRLFYVRSVSAVGEDL